MATIRIRLQTATGTSHIETLPTSTATVFDLRAAAARAAGLSPDDEAASSRLVLRTGFPPRALDLAAFELGCRLADTPWQLDGARIAVEVVGEGGEGDRGAGDAGSAAAPPLQLARPSAAAAAAAAATKAKDKDDADRDPPAVPVPAEHASLVLRVMPDDNSCLFRALALALTGTASDGAVSTLRQAVASNVLAADPEGALSDAALGRPRGEYARWIVRDESWGGYIELSVLARMFGVGIVAVDVQSGAVVDCAPEGGDGGGGGTAPSSWWCTRGSTTTPWRWCPRACRWTSGGPTCCSSLPPRSPAARPSAMPCSRPRRSWHASSRPAGTTRTRRASACAASSARGAARGRRRRGATPRRLGIRGSRRTSRIDGMGRWMLPGVLVELITTAGETLKEVTGLYIFMEDKLQLSLHATNNLAHVLYASGV
jgi:hypothetical protein